MEYLEEVGSGNTSSSEAPHAHACRTVPNCLPVVIGYAQASVNVLMHAGRVRFINAFDTRVRSDLMCQLCPHDSQYTPMPNGHYTRAIFWHDSI